jgi:hypothetical protein
MIQADVERLERGVRTLRDSLADLSKPADFEELVQIWRRPGWTTPAEFALVAGTIDSMVSLTKNLAEMKQVLMKGSREVETKS